MSLNALLEEKPCCQQKGPDKEHWSARLLLGIMVVIAVWGLVEIVRFLLKP